MRRRMGMRWIFEVRVNDKFIDCVVVVIVIVVLIDFD